MLGFVRFAAEKPPLVFAFVADCRMELRSSRRLPLLILARRRPKLGVEISLVGRQA
jgi:hypothetical protein